MAEVTEYKGNPMLVLNPGDKYLFQFGLQKAKLIMQNLDAIRDFIEQNDGGGGRQRRSTAAAADSNIPPPERLERKRDQLSNDDADDSDLPF